MWWNCLDRRYLRFREMRNSNSLARSSVHYRKAVESHSPIELPAIFPLVSLVAFVGRVFGTKWS